VKVLGRLGAFLLALSALATPGAAEIELLLSSWLPPHHPIVVNAIKPWADRVGEVTQGRVKVRVLRKPLGSPSSHFEICKDGLADIAYGLHSFTRGNRFPGARIGQFSFLGDDAVVASRAFWTVYTEDLDAVAEHQGTKLLGLFVHGPGFLHTVSRKIETPEDFAGLRLRVPGGYIAELVADLGGEPLFLSSPEVYQRLSRRQIDGVAFTYEALTAFGLTDYIGYSMQVPGGIYNTTWFLVMNEDKWGRIDPADRAAIESVSGPAFADLVGKAWRDADNAAAGAIGAAGIDVYPAPDAVLAGIRRLGQKREALWAEKLGPDRDGAAALARLRRLSGGAG